MPKLKMGARADRSRRRGGGGVVEVEVCIKSKDDCRRPTLEQQDPTYFFLLLRPRNALTPLVPIPEGHEQRFCIRPSQIHMYNRAQQRRRRRRRL